MKKMKLLMMLGICSVLGLGTAVAISCTTKQNVKASEIVDDSEDEEEEENSRGLTDYYIVQFRNDLTYFLKKLINKGFFIAKDY